MGKVVVVVGGGSSCGTGRTLSGHWSCTGGRGVQKVSVGEISLTRNIVFH